MNQSTYQDLRQYNKNDERCREETQKRRSKRERHDLTHYTPAERI